MGNCASIEIKDRNAKRRSSIICVIRVAGKKLKVPTGVSVHPSVWCMASKRVTTANPEYRRLNDKIMKVKRDLEEAYFVCSQRVGRQSITVDAVQREYERMTTTDVVEVVTEYMREKESLGKNVGKLPVLIRRLHEFMLTQRYSRIDIYDPPRDFVNEFVEFLRKADLCEATVWNYLKDLRTSIKRFAPEGESSPICREIGPIKRDLEIKPKFREYLTREEKESFLAEKPTNGSERRALLYALIQMETGLRYSDVCRLATGELNLCPNKRGTYDLSYRAQKTKKPGGMSGLQQTVFEAVHSIQTLPLLANATCNRSIKTIALRAGLTRSIYSEDGQSMKPLSDLLRTHAFKRTFVHLKLEAGRFLREVAAMTGNSMRTIEMYVPSYLPRVDVNDHDEPFESSTPVILQQPQPAKMRPSNIMPLPSVA